MTQYPRICVLLENYYPRIGGVETQTRNTVKALIKKGINFFIVTRRYSKNIPRKDVIDNVNVFRIPPLGSNSIFKKWSMIFPAFLYLFKLRNKYDIIFVPGFNLLGIPAAIFSKLLRKKCVFRASNPGEISGEHSLPSLEKETSIVSAVFLKLIIPLKKKLLRRVDRFIATTRELEADFLSNRIEPEKIERIPNGVDTELFSPVSAEEKLKIRKKLSIPEDKVIVTFVGRLVRWKGVPLLVRAWEMVVRDCPEAQLYIVGPGVPNIDGCDDELKEIIRNLGIEKKVTLTGGVYNVNEYLNASDIFASPAEYEAFGIAVLEAMSCALPVVVTSAGGMKETVKNNEHGFSVPVNDMELLRASLASLIKDKTLREKMGQASRSWVENNFSINSSAEKYFNLFRSLMQEKKADPALQFADKT
jgi:glycosyltransferase involved in cell wall biosynthesis